MAKRKRETASVSPSSSAQSASSTPVGDKHKHKRRREQDDPKIVYELADGSRRIERRLGKDKTLRAALYRVTEKLDISTPGSIRLTQVREGGREVEIYDEFDFTAFKQRSRAAQATSIVVKVYPGARPAEPTSLPSSAFSTPAQAGPSSRPLSPATPRSILSSPSSATPQSSTSQKTATGKKSVSIIEPPSTPSSSSDVSRSPAPTTPKNKDQIKKKKKQKPQSKVATPTVPVVSITSPNLPEGLTVTSRALDILSKYKPARPSPLSKPTQLDSDTSEIENEKDKARERVSSPTKSRRRKRKSMGRDGQQLAHAEAWGSRAGDQADRSIPLEQTAQPAIQNASEPLENVSTPVIAPELQAATGSPAGTFSSQAADLASTSKETFEIIPEHSPADTVPEANTAPTPTMAKKKRNRKFTKPTDVTATLVPSVETPVASSPVTLSTPAPLDATPSKAETIPLPVSKASNQAAAHPSPSVPPPPSTPSPTRPKPVIIHLASPWNLQNKPEEPRHEENYSSSSIETPRKRKAASAARKSKEADKSVEGDDQVLVPDSQPSRFEGSATSVSPASEHAAGRRPGSATSPAVKTKKISTEAPSIAETQINPSVLKETAPETTSSAAPTAMTDEAFTSRAPSKSKNKGRKSDVAKGNIASEIMALYRAKQAAESVAKGAEPQSAETNTESGADIGASSVPHESVAVSNIGVAPAAPTEEGRLASEDQSTDDVPSSATAPTGDTEAHADTDVQSESELPAETENPASPAPKSSSGVGGEDGVREKTVTGAPSDEQTDVGSDEQRQRPQRKTRQKAPLATESLPNGHDEPRTPATSRALKSTTAPSSGGPKPERWWSVPAEGMRKGGREEIAILASRAACIICGQTPTHLQKDCPDVLKGRGNLESLLLTRQDQIIHLEQDVSEQASRPKGRKGKKQPTEEEERLSMAQESVDVIQRWLGLLQARETAQKRPSAASAAQSQEIKPHPVWGQVNGNGGPDDNPLPKEVASAESQEASPEESQTVLGVVTETPETLVDASSERDVPPGTLTQTVFPRQPRQTSSTTKAPRKVESVQASLEEEAMSSFPLHQLALQRMNRRKRPGSLSGLSASDAVIETGDSDSDSSDSDSDSSPQSPVASILGGVGASDSTSDSASSVSEVDRDERDAPSVSPAIVEEHPDSEDGDNEDSESASTSASSQGSNDSGNDSEKDSSPGSSFPSRSPSPSIDSIADDAEASMLHFLSQPLSAKEKRRARLSAASAATQQNVDIEMDIELPPSETDDVEDDETPFPSRQSGRRDSDSSIDVGVDDDEKMEVDDEIVPSSLTQPPTLVQSDIDSDNGSQNGNEDQRSSSRSFVNLDREAGPSPAVDYFDGAIALEEAIREEEMPRVLVDETMEDRQSGRSASQGRRGATSSQEETIVPTQAKEVGTQTRKSVNGFVASSQPAEDQSQRSGKSQASQAADEPSQPKQSLRRSSRRSASVTTSPLRSTQGLPNGSIPPRTPTRRLRSASRDLPDPVPSPRASQRGSASQQSKTASTPVKINGTPRGRKSASVTMSPEQTRRVTRSRSRTTPDRVPLPPSSQANGLQLELIEEHETPKATRGNSNNVTPTSQVEARESSAAIPEEITSDADSETHTPTAARATKTQASPLFMSQGSQVPKTQHYASQDSSFPADSLPCDGHGDVRSSPIPEDQDQSEEGDDGASVQTSSDDDADLPPIRPIAAIRRAASQGPPVLMPRLSGLDSTLLRAGPTKSGLRNGSASQPVTRSKIPTESESEMSSSSEDEAPAHRSRYATGRNVKKTTSKTNGVMRGW